MIARFLRQLGILLGIALLPALVSGAIQVKWRADAPLAPNEVRPATARMWGEKVQWVDARTQAQFDRGHLPGAVLLNEDQWDALIPGFLDKWDPDKTLVVYCDGGKCDASHAVAERLRTEMQVANVYVLKGGWAEWQRGP